MAGVDGVAEAGTRREGEGMNTYLFDYYHDGATYCFEIKADSREDAEARIKKAATRQVCWHAGFQGACTTRLVCEAVVQDCKLLPRWAMNVIRMVLHWLLPRRRKGRVK